MDPKAEVKKVEIKAPKSARELELEAQLAKAEAAKLDAEQNAVAKVAEAVGIDPKSLEAFERDKGADDLMEYDIGEQTVYINGFAFRGVGRAPAKVVEMIVSLAGNVRMRKLKEVMGNDIEADQISSSNIRTRKV